MRPEARAAVDAGLLTLPPMGAVGLERDERVAKERAQMEAMVVRVPEAQDTEIAGVRCRVIRPEGEPRGVYLHFHGGGMVTGLPDMMDVPNRDIARTFGLVVVSANYRKAPEHPWPAGPDDGEAVANWLLEHATDEFGTSTLLIGGESAGGYMTAAVALRLRDTGDIGGVSGLNLVYGVYDFGRSPSQRGLRATDGPDLLDPEQIAFITECYLPGRTDDERRSPEISPAFADLHGLPPSFFSVGTCDHLVDDTLLMASRATAAGVDVELFVAPEMPHAMQVFPCSLMKLWDERLAAWFEARLTRPPPVGSARR